MHYLIYQAENCIKPHNVPFIYSHAFNKPLSRVEHCHDFYEIIFLFTGKATHSINGISYEMNEGDVAFLRPYEAHVFASQTQEIDLYSISVPVEEFEPLLDAYHLLNVIQKTDGMITYTLEQNIKHFVYTSFQQLDVCSNTQKESNLRIILGNAIHQYMQLLSEVSNEWIDKIMLKMRQPNNLQEGISAFLRISNLSHAQLCRTIKKKTGKTPQQFIKSLRMSYAYDLVLSTNLPYEEISYLVGYQSFSHFVTSFKKHFGISPSALRKQSTLL